MASTPVNIHQCPFLHFVGCHIKKTQNLSERPPVLKWPSFLLAGLMRCRRTWMFQTQTMKHRPKNVKIVC